MKICPHAFLSPQTLTRRYFLPDPGLVIKPALSQHGQTHCYTHTFTNTSLYCISEFKFAAQSKIMLKQNTETV